MPYADALLNRCARRLGSARRSWCSYGDGQTTERRRVSRVRVPSPGGGASKNQPLRIPGQPFYLGERKLAVPTCRDEVADVLGDLAVGGGERVVTVGDVYAVMVAGGTSWSRETVAKTMLRMTVPARRPPYVRLERAAVNRYRIR